MHYAVALAGGFWAVVAGLLVGFWHGWWPGSALIALGALLITLVMWRAMTLDYPDPYEDEHVSSL